MRHHCDKLLHLVAGRVDGLDVQDIWGQGVGRCGSDKEAWTRDPTPPTERIRKIAQTLLAHGGLGSWVVGSMMPGLAARSVGQDFAR